MGGETHLQVPQPFLACFDDLRAFFFSCLELCPIYLRMSLSLRAVSVQLKGGKH